MSSPKRAAKPAARRANGKRAGKAAPRRETVAVPAKPAGNGASVDAKRLAAALERSIADGKLDLVSAEALQALIAAACRVYSARTENRGPLVPAKAGMSGKDNAESGRTLIERTPGDFPWI